MQLYENKMHEAVVHNMKGYNLTTSKISNLTDVPKNSSLTKYPKPNYKYLILKKNLESSKNMY